MSCLEVIVQKTGADCAVAALAMLAGRPYRAVSDAARTVAPTAHSRGLYTTQILTIAESIGFPLKAIARPASFLKVSVVDHTGILTVRRKKDDHAVVLFQGVIVDPMNGMVWDFETFLAQGPWVVNGFLVER